jgi:hypothetical protein
LLKGEEDGGGILEMFPLTLTGVAPLHVRPVAKKRKHSNFEHPQSLFPRIRVLEIRQKRKQQFEGFEVRLPFSRHLIHQLQEILAVVDSLEMISDFREGIQNITTVHPNQPHALSVKKDETNMGEEAESVLKPPSASPGSLRDTLDLPKIFREEGNDPVGFPIRNRMRYDGMRYEDGHRRKTLKLPALKGGASRKGISFYIVPLPACRKAGTPP